MRMLRVAYEWPPPWVGLAPAPYGITKAQAGLGHKITVFCGRWPRAGSIERISGVALKFFFRAPVQGLMLVTVAPLMSAYFLLWRLLSKVDLYHVHGHFGLYIYLYKYLLGFMDKTPLVSHFHINAKARWEEAKREGKKIKFLTRYVDWPLHVLSDILAVKSSSACIFVGEKDRDNAIKYYDANPEKCHVVESGYDPDLFYPPSPKEREEERSSLGVLGGEVLILNDGALVERKNIHVLAEALKYLPNNYKLLLVGNADKNYKAKLEVSDRIRLLPPVTLKEIGKFYHAADLYVLPSSYEGFPKVIVQSLASGVPTIASGFTLPKIRGLYALEKIEPKALAERIKEVLELGEIVDSQFVRDTFSWEKRAVQIEEVYRKIAYTKSLGI